MSRHGHPSLPETSTSLSTAPLDPMGSTERLTLRLDELAKRLGKIGQTVQVESPCARTGHPVRVTVTPEGVTQVEPPDAVVSLVAPEASPDVRRVFCDYVNFLQLAETAAGWLAERPGATTLPFVEAYQLGRRLTESVFRHWASPGRPAAR